MFAVAYDCPPDPSAVMAFAALVLAVPVWFVAALVWRFVEPFALPRLVAAFRAASAVEVRVPAFVGRVRSAVPALVVWAANRSGLVFALVCRYRAASARYTGLAQYEEWAAEIASIPSASARAALMNEIRRYYPSDRLVHRARSLRGKRCAEVRAAEVRRRLIEG